MKNENLIGEVKWEYFPDKIQLTFTDHIFGDTTVKYYKTRAAAKAQETKFFNRCNRAAYWNQF